MSAHHMDFSSPSFTLTDSSGAMSGGATGTTSPGTIYSYTAPVTGGYDAAGNLKNSTDLVMGAWNYTYDTLNRLQAGTPTSGLYETPTAQYACFAYDSFGNRKAGAMQTTACPTPETSVPSTVTYSATNQVTFVSGSLPLGLSYDGAGNVTSDGLNYYAYDGEGRLCAVENTLVDSYTQYVYDAGGTRVAKGASASLTCGAPGSNFSLTNQYLVGLGGEQVTELDGSDDWLHTNVWAGGRLLATYDGFGIHFPLTDPLGTKRIQANAYGAVDETCFSLPYGDGLNCIGDDATEHHFTGKERDAESGNDYFGARYYASSMGRFLSPDPKIMTARHLANPQKWNKYAYVINNPLMRFDPDGMDDYVVFRTASAGMNGKQWAAAEKSITGQKDSQGRYNTFHMVEGSNVTAAAYNKALGTADTHVVLVGHTISATEGGHPWGAVLSNSGTDTLTVSTGSGGTLHWPSISDPAFQSSGFNPIADGPTGIQASSVAVFGCNSFDLASQYSGTSFTGIQSGADGLTAVPTTDAAAAAWVGAGGGQAGDNAANGVLGASQYPTDAGDSVRTQTPPPPPQTQQPNQ